ncbi:sulfhydryl oxidase 2-like [Glandiceps talaboti]
MAAVSVNNMLIASLRYLILLHLFQLSLSEHKLYKEADGLVLLDGNNIEKNIFDTKNAWMIEFYSSWCGHCVRFAPNWKALAQDIKGWHNVIKLGAIDCSEEINLKTCRDYGIGGYPSFKFYNASTSSGMGEFYKGKRVIDDMRHGIVNYIEQQYNAKKTQWPDFSIPSLEWIHSVFTSGNQPTTKVLFLIFEDSTSYIGREVMLDVQNYDEILVRRVSNEAQYEKLTSQFSVDTYPSLYVMHPDNTYKRLIVDGTRESYRISILSIGLPAKSFNIPGPDQGGGEINLGVQGINNGEQAVQNGDNDNMLRKFLHGENGGLPQEQQDTGQQQQDQNEMMPDLVPNQPQDKGQDEQDNSNKKTTQFTVTYLPVYMQDLESTLHYSFRHEIPLHDVIEGDRLEALKKFVDVLAKFFPGRPQIMSYLEELNYWVEDNGDYKITSDDWLEFVNERYDPEKAPDTYLPTRLKWVGCKGSSKIYRGYPCGLWTLFHTLTVRAATTKKYYTLEEKLEVLPAMRGYIIQFFGCRECADNFDKMAATISASVKTPDEAVLWLWRSHNKANNRLHGDASEDPQHPKVQFPPKQLCPSCQEYTDTEWLEDQVLKFLKEYYHVNNIRLDQLSRYIDKIRDDDDNNLAIDPNMSYNSRREQRQVFVNGRLQSVKDRPVKTGFFGLGMNGLDMSMCVLLYGFCIGLVFLLYIIFCKRRKRKVQKHIV